MTANVCRNIEVSNAINSNIIGIGYNVLSNSSFDDINGVIISIGDDSLKDSKIYGINKLIVQGDNAMDNVVIHSSGVQVNQNTFFANLNGMCTRECYYYYFQSKN